MWSKRWRRCCGGIYPFSKRCSPSEELSKRPGYQRDPQAAIQEARRLVAEAGYPNGIKNLDFLVRKVTTFKLWAVAIQAMLNETLNTETKLRMVQISVWFEEVQAGKFDLGISAIVSTLMDPSDYSNTWSLTNGPQNYSKWPNPEFDALVKQINRETETAKHKNPGVSGRTGDGTGPTALAGLMGENLRRFLQVC